MLVMVFFFIAFRWIHLSTPLIRLFLLVLILLLMPSLNFLPVWFAFFFFSSRRRHTRWTGDWSSDVCSSDLGCPSANRKSSHRAARSIWQQFGPPGPSLERGYARFPRRHHGDVDFRQAPSRGTVGAGRAHFALGVGHHGQDAHANHRAGGPQAAGEIISVGPTANRVVLVCIQQEETEKTEKGIPLCFLCF